MKKFISTLITGCLLAAPTLALELAKYPKAFSTHDGVNIVVAPSKDGQQALLKVSGINHDIDGVVFLSDIVSRGGDTKAYQFKRDGEQRALLLRQKGWRGEYYEAFLPEQGQVGLAADEELKKSVDLTALLALYQQQKAKGVQEKIARFDRQGHQAEDNKALAAMDNDTNAACDSKLTTKVNWDNTSDDIRMAVSIPGYCGVVADQLETLCNNEPAFKARVQAIKTIHCEFGDKLKVELVADQLNFTTAKNEPNQGEFVRSYFRNL